MTFTVYGPIVSANRIRAPFEGQMRKTKDAREDAKRVRLIATTAAAGWAIPEAATVAIIAWNSRIDADNVSKCLLDAIKGVAWRDDADVMDISVSRRWDDGGERYEIIITASADYRPGRGGRARAKRPFGDLQQGQLLSFHERDALLKKVGILR